METDYTLIIVPTEQDDNGRYEFCKQPVIVKDNVDKEETLSSFFVVDPEYGCGTNETKRLSDSGTIVGTLSTYMLFNDWLENSLEDLGIPIDAVGIYNLIVILVDKNSFDPKKFKNEIDFIEGSPVYDSLTPLVDATLKGHMNNRNTEWNMSLHNIAIEKCRIEHESYKKERAEREKEWEKEYRMEQPNRLYSLLWKVFYKIQYWLTKP